MNTVLLGYFLFLFWFLLLSFSSVQSLSRVQLFGTPWIAAHQASLVHHQLPEFTQTHVYWVIDAIQPSHPLSSPSPPTLNFSQHQGLSPMSRFFVSGGQSIGVSASASVLPMNTQDWLRLTGCISMQSKRLSRVFPNTTDLKHQFSDAQPSLWSNYHIHTWLLENPC